MVCCTACVLYGVMHDVLHGAGLFRTRVRVSKLDEIEEENYVTQRDVIRELSS